MLQRNDLSNLLGHGREERYLEYKQSMDWSSVDTKDKIRKFTLGASNIRDGGFVIFGVENSTFDPIGMSQTDYDSFSQDDVLADINAYADPFVNLILHKFENSSHNKFVIIEVKEFEEIPTICKRASNELREGAIYTRSRRIAETCIVRNQTEMREIIEMAADKSLRRLMERLSRSGLDISTVMASTDQRLYDNQIGELIR